MAKVVLDNDVVAKCGAYSLLLDIAEALGVDDAELGVLGTLRFVIKKKHLKCAGVGWDDAYLALQDFLQAIETIEPSEDESRLAAIFEETAIKLGLNFDVGESQLCAVAIVRRVDVFCTGDKRAIRSAEKLLGLIAEIDYLKQRVLPLEALVMRMMKARGFLEIQETICASKGVDMSLEVCFQCSSPTPAQQEAELGLESYLKSLKKSAPQITLQ